MEPIWSNARELRNKATDAERKLWQHLKSRQPRGIKFRRQYPIAGYVADFAAPEIRLVIELDGGQHLEQREYDRKRTKKLACNGYRVLRFWNDEVLLQAEHVLSEILRMIDATPPPALPCIRRGGGQRRKSMKILVTGGGGFLGQALCRGLVERGHQVISFNRGHYPVLAELGVGQVQGDLADAHALTHAADGVEAIFHNAAKAGAWGSYDSYYSANVIGTQNVLDACRTHGIGKLVYTSTPSVTHRATHPVEGGTAYDVPYGVDFQAPYAETKAIAEKAVLAANSATLATIALRPRLIWGPGDQQILPRLVERAKAGRLRIVGDGSNLVDTTYIDNAAQAHFDAFEHLAVGTVCAGRVYFISNGEPKPMGELLNALLDAAGAPRVDKHLSFKAAYRIGTVCETLWKILPLKGEPPMTRFLAEQLSTTHWYDMAPATRDFGYRPRVSFDEGLTRLKQSLQKAAAIT